ncbi:hypothetical protein BDZ97DRAFT_1834996, partial [Flammula alnicola]
SKMLADQGMRVRKVLMERRKSRMGFGEHRENRVLTLSQYSRGGERGSQTVGRGVPRGKEMGHPRRKNTNKTDKRKRNVQLSHPSRKAGASCQWLEIRAVAAMWLHSRPLRVVENDESSHHRKKPGRTGTRHERRSPDAVHTVKPVASSVLGHSLTASGDYRVTT